MTLQVDIDLAQTQEKKNYNDHNRKFLQQRALPVEFFLGATLSEIASTSQK
jgi:hypothetical protein